MSNTPNNIEARKLASTTLRTYGWIIGIFALVCIVGCGEDTQTPGLPEFVTLAYGDPWEIESINGEAFEKSFYQQKDNAVEHEFVVTANSVVFSRTGSFTIDLEFRAVEKYATSPRTEMTALISYTARGSYTTQENILTFTKQSTEIDVEVNLGPEAAWKQQIEGITLEQLKSDLAADIKEGIAQDTPPLFHNTEYTWQVEDGSQMMTISKPGQKIVLIRLIVHEVIG